MPFRIVLPVLAILAGLALPSAVPVAAQTLIPQPDSSMMFSTGPAVPADCSKLGRRFFKKKECQCVKCGWTYFPPKRLCWRVC